MKLKTILEKGLLLPTLFILCALLAIIFSFRLPINIIECPFNFIGFIFIFMGLCIPRAASNQFKKVKTNINAFDEPDKLVVSGLFEYNRNSMYFGFVIALLGISIILGTISAFIILIMFILITDQWYIKFEEKMMIKKFGDKYMNYMKTTRRWI